MAGRAGEGVDTAIRQASVDSGRAMSSAAKGAGGDTASNELYKLNQVFYRSIPSVSTVKTRNLQRQNFQLTGYQGLQQQTIQCIFNTGENFVNPRQSFLFLQLGIPLVTVATTKGDDVHAFFGPGGAGSIIDEIWLQSASGTEICREQNKGLNLTHYLINNLQPDYYRRNGSQEGLCGPNLSDTFSGRGYCRNTGGLGTFFEGSAAIQNKSGVYASGGTSAVVGGPLNVITPSVITEQGAVDITFFPNGGTGRSAGAAPWFAIPLNHLLGCFDPYMNVLIPGIALAGATLTIRIKNLAEPLIITGSGIEVNGGATPALQTTYARAIANTAEIYQIYMMMDCYQMNDAIVKKINQISASPNGLTMMFDTWDWSSTSTTNTAVEAQVSQARSRISMSYCVVRDATAATNPFIPSLLSEGASSRLVGPGTVDQDVMTTATPPIVDTYQAILGNLYFPQQPIQNLQEAYINHLYMFGKNFRDERDLSTVSFQDFCGARGQFYIAAGVPQPPSTNVGWCFPYGAALYGLTAERSELLQLTGLTLSNARLLRHRFNFSGAAIGGAGRQIDVFTNFTRQMKIYLGGRIIMKE